MRALAFIFFAVGAPDAWALLDARAVLRRSNRRLSTNFAQLKLTACVPSCGGSDFFGNSVAIDGDTIVVGADGDDDAGTRSGSAYVFSTTAALGSDSATRAGGTLATALLAFAATALAL